MPDASQRIEHIARLPSKDDARSQAAKARMLEHEIEELRQEREQILRAILGA